ncbi:Disintegrin and metalloproteinase domain-containing protein 15 [Apodemus speciosus]|uniref:Disintegrin and metalloproteinase domain-containing protein 15 n=1 Tax=Apodemus speciosus TaxID=105296 RepID=A0ABQ0EKZ2_APOSI
MRLALLWALGLLGAGSPRPSPPLPNIGGTEEEQPASPERALSGPLESQVAQDSPPMSLAEVLLQTGLPEALRIALELDGERHTLELLQSRDLVPGRPTLVWYQPDGTRVVSEGYSLGKLLLPRTSEGPPQLLGLPLCLLWDQGAGSPVPREKLFTGAEPWRPSASSHRLSDPRPPDARPHLCPKLACLCTRSGRTRPPSGTAPHPQATHQKASDLITNGCEPPCGCWDLNSGPLEEQSLKRDVVTETKIVELVIVADNSEVRKYSDFQHLLNRTLEVALLLDTFFQPLNVRVVLVGLEAWTQHDLIEMSSNPAVLLDNFLRWRRTDLLPRLPHDSAQLVTMTSFSGPMVGMAVQNSICSPDFSGGVNMGEWVQLQPRAASWRPPQSLNFSNCSRQALDKALLDGMGGCLFERLPSLAPMSSLCGNMFVDPGEQCDCGFPDECTDPCCDYSTCQLRPGAQCASDGLCCQNCKLRPAGWQCRLPTDDCDLPEFCPGDSAQCPPDIRLGDGEPCASGEAVCMHGRCASYARQCQSLWGPGSQPAAPLCLQTANTRGNAFGSCGRSSSGSYMPCAPRDAFCGQLQCQSGRSQPLLGSVRDRLSEVLEANGTQLNCSWVDLDLGNDVAQPLLALPGTACGPGQVCIGRRCQPVDLLGAQECRSKCHGHGVCDSSRHCHCDEGWAPPDCMTQLKATSSLTTGLLLSLLLLLVLVLLGASYWHRARLHQRLCQLKGSSCQYRAAQSGPPERPGPPQRAQQMPGTKDDQSHGNNGALCKRTFRVLRSDKAQDIMCERMPVPGPTPSTFNGKRQASVVSFPVPPSRPLPPNPVPKKLQWCSSLGDQGAPSAFKVPEAAKGTAALADRSNPPTRPLPADPVVRRPKCLRGLPNPHPQESHCLPTHRAVIRQVTCPAPEMEACSWCCPPGQLHHPQQHLRSTSDLPRFGCLLLNSRTQRSGTSARISPKTLEKQEGTCLVSSPKEPPTTRRC